MIPEIGKKYNINYLPWPSFIKEQSLDKYKGIGTYGGDSRIETYGMEYGAEASEIIYWFTDLEGGKCGWFSSEDIISEYKEEV
jgi:hypothetical protein